MSVSNQDPDVLELSLSAQDMRVLLEFLRVALLDGLVEVTPPEKLVLRRGLAR